MMPTPLEPSAKWANDAQSTLAAIVVQTGTAHTIENTIAIAQVQATLAIVNALHAMYGEMRIKW